MEEKLAQLQALKNGVENLNKIWASSLPLDEFESFANRFSEISRSLLMDKSELFLGYKPHDYKKYLQGDYSKEASRTLIIDISFFIDIINGMKSIAIPNLKITNEGIFFAGQYFDAISKLVDIIKLAKSEIILIDGYTNEKLLDIFAACEGKIKIKILTKDLSIKEPFITLIKDFNRQYNNCLEYKTSEVFHDRFLIIDDINFFHFGASVKDLGNKGFMFSKIEESFIQSLLLEQFRKEWK